MLNETLGTLLSKDSSPIDQLYPFLAAGKSVVFHTKLGAFVLVSSYGLVTRVSLRSQCLWQEGEELTTACTTYARSFAAAMSRALFSVSLEHISLIQVMIKGPAPP